MTAIKAAFSAACSAWPSPLRRVLQHGQHGVIVALADKSCEACEGGVPPLHPDEVTFLMEQIPAWREREGWIVRDLERPNFVAALDAVNRIGTLAEQEGHHPDLLIHGYRNLRIRMQTHAVGGLTENDFILAAKIDRVLNV